MKNKKIICLIFFFFISHVNFSYAAATRVVTFYGKRTCAEWINVRQQAKLNSPRDMGISELTVKSWVTGFLSGYNYAQGSNKDLLNSFPADSAFLWVDNYCRSNPKEDLVRAVHTLAEELLKVSK